MEHRGEIIEKAIRNSGIPLTSIARKVGKSRQWVYLLFQNPNVSLNVVIQIGKIIYHDFSGEIKGLTSDVNHFHLSTLLLAPPFPTMAFDLVS